MCYKIIRIKVGSVMKIQKKYIVLSSLVLALATAVYINWQLAGSKPQAQQKELGAASYVSATVSPSSSDQAVESSALSKSQKNYFASERTKRQATQDKIIDTAKDTLGDNSSDESLKSDAQKSIEKVIKNFTVQDSIESIVKAKGFSECLCCISDEGVTVIVPEKELNNTSSLVIDDAVTSHCDVDYENISIVGV